MKRALAVVRERLAFWDPEAQRVVERLGASTPVVAMETQEEAGARLRVKAVKLGARARAERLLPARTMGEPARLPSTSWDRVAALCIAERKRSGPAPGFREGRVARGHETLRAAADRLRVNADSLRRRAWGARRSYADGLTRATWDALAEGLPTNGQRRRAA
jgi:hypothetical protein